MSDEIVKFSNQFNAVEMAEKRSDARPAKKIMVALPQEPQIQEQPGYGYQPGFQQPQQWQQQPWN